MLYDFPASSLALFLAIKSALAIVAIDFPPSTE